jgi:hypothetical protein
MTTSGRAGERRCEPYGPWGSFSAIEGTGSLSSVHPWRSFASGPSHGELQPD